LPLPSITISDAELLAAEPLDAELLDDELGATTRTTPPPAPSSKPIKRAGLRVFAGLVASVMAATVALLGWLPNDATHHASAARLDVPLAMGPSAPPSVAPQQLAAPKAATPPAQAQTAKAKSGRGKPGAKAQAAKPGKKSTKLGTKRVTPAPKKRPAA
jgi:hypothetical protein